MLRCGIGVFACCLNQDLQDHRICRIMVSFLSENWLLSESRIITDDTDDADFKRFHIQKLSL